MVLPVFPRNISYRARPKSPPFQFFFGTVRHFFRIFFRNFFSSKGPPCIFFDVLRQNGCWKNSKGFLLSVFFGIVRFYPENKKNFSSIFSCFATEWMLKNLKGSPLSVFRHCETLARHSVLFLVCNFFKKKFEKFSIFDYCKRILDTWKSFCYF